MTQVSLAAAVSVLFHPWALASEQARAVLAPSSVGEVLVLPWDAPPGTEQVGSWRAEVADEGAFRVYRVELQGRTYWTHRSLDGRPRSVAFLPNEARFADVLPSLRVVLRDSQALEAVIDAAGALEGKAYPPGWVLLHLPPEVNPADVAEELRSHPSVTSVELQLQQPRFRPLQPSGGNVTPLQDDDSSYKDSPAADLFVDVLAVTDDSAEEAHPDVFTVVGSFENRGAAASSETTVTWVLNESSDFEEPEALSGEFTLPALSPGEDGLEIPITFDVAELPDTSEGVSYYARIEVAAVPEEPDRNRDNNSAVFGFTVAASGGPRFTARCDQVSPRGQEGSSGADPLFDEQWNLVNRGQRAFANRGGQRGEDLNMGEVIDDPSAPTGAGVRLAVVDQGLEVCHPDLAANVEPGKSRNFLAPDQPPGARRDDPFFPATTGDHGTAVAGIAAARADNGIGGRGVAPDALLRGYNFLPAQYKPGVYFDSLGMSRINPDSTGVDIFNMSFGSSRFGNAHPATVELFKHGVENLREGLGAIYVKAAGNAFRWCSSFFVSVNRDIGCMGANMDASNNLPYLTVVGALNADGVRASYSSTGSNLWISAPAGEYGIESPAMITTDQMTTRRGYDWYGIGLSTQSSLNPNGNYVSMMSGTSSAAPNTSGAVALLLEARPDLSWRDVKHILARTARQVHAGIAPVEYLLSNGHYELLQGWTRNDAGYEFHNWYGFGAVDVDSALNLAAAHQTDSLGEYWETLPYTRDTLRLPMADANSEGARDQLRVSDLGPQPASVEWVSVTVRIDHPFPHDLAIELTSPSGTRSVLNPAFNDVLGPLKNRGHTIVWNLLSNAFYGEDPSGDWELEVIDAATLNEGYLVGWDLRFGLGSHAPGIHPAGAQDDHGNIRRAATAIRRAGSFPGVLEIGGDKDYFRIVVRDPTTLVVSTEGGTDTLGVLEDEDGLVLVSDSDGGPGNNFRIVYRLMPGTYYLRVQGQDTATTGAYSVVLQLDSAGPVQARAYAIAPETAADQSWVRVRCESPSDCPVMLECRDQSGNLFEATLPDLPARGTETLYATDLLRLFGASSWEFRLACLVRSPERVSAQVWTQSGSDDVLVNNTAILDSDLDSGVHVARAYALPAPNSPSGNVLNLRVRCESSDSCDGVRLRCFDDRGRSIGSPGLVERSDRNVVGGVIPPWAVAHLQADHVASIIGVSTWPDLEMSCDVESQRPISVQILTRSGGSGGPLVNNTALSPSR